MSVSGGVVQRPDAEPTAIEERQPLHYRNAAMQPLVYIETTVFSFRYDTRPSATVQAMHEWTCSWWDTAAQNYELVTSVPVLVELERGNLPHREQALALALSLPAMPVEDEIADIVDFYIKDKLMPDDPVGDPMHLALASYHKCDYLLTWNCKHLANANKALHLRRANALLGLHVPVLTTPLELMNTE